MRVTFCAYDRPGYVGGPNAGLMRLLPALKARGLRPECLLLTFGDEGQCPAMRTLRENDIPFQHAPYHPTTQQRVRWLLEAASRRRPDVFVPNLMPAAYFTAAHLKKRGIPSIGVMRSDDDFHHQLEELFITGRDRDRVDHWVCVSEYLRDRISPHVSRAEAIPSSCDHCGAASRSGLPGPTEGQPLKIVYSGRLVERQKRISTLTEALCRLTRRRDDVQAAIVGDGPDRERVEAVLRRYPDAAVTLHPPVNSACIQDVLREHHAAILASEYEGLPLCLLEAMDAGLVPLATPTRSGIPELVEDGKTGFLLRDLDADLDRAVDALRTPGTFERISTAATELVRSRYSPETCADNWAELIRDAGSSATPKRIRMPLRLDLPANNGLREDDRATPLEDVRTTLASLFARGHHPFVNPRCLPRFADLYTVRKRILGAVQDILPLAKGRVVDIGAGSAPYRNLFLDAPDVSGYLAVDFDCGPYDAPDMAWDGCRLPLDDASAGTVVLTEVLEHCEDAAAVLREARRILEPGGLLFLTVPFLWPLHDVPQDVCRYTPWTLEKLLAEAGFTDARVRPLGGFDAAMAQMLGLYVRRRSRRPIFTRIARPLLSMLAAPAVKALNAMDKPKDDFREGLMITGLYATARKQGGDG